MRHRPRAHPPRDWPASAARLDGLRVIIDGSAVTTTSPSWKSISRPGTSAFMYSVKWDSTAPFGVPVVPDV